MADRPGADGDVWDERDDAESIAQAREATVDAMADVAETYGGKRSYGHLYGVLFFADEPQSLDALVVESGYAKSTVSTAMGTLEDVGLVERRSRPGEGKRAFFEAEEAFWNALQQCLETTVREDVEDVSRSLGAAELVLEEVDTPAARDDLERVRRLLALTEQCETVLDAVTDRPLEDFAVDLDDG